MRLDLSLVCYRVLGVCCDADNVYQLPLEQYGYTGHVINLPGDICALSSYTVDELHDMRWRGFLQQSSPLCCKYSWYQTVLVQRGHLISMVDTLGLTSVFFTHSTADLISSDPDSSASRIKAVTSYCWLVLLSLSAEVCGNILPWCAQGYWLLDVPWMAEQGQSTCAWSGMATKCSEQLLKKTDNIESVKDEVHQQGSHHHQPSCHSWWQ